MEKIRGEFDVKMFCTNLRHFSNYSEYLSTTFDKYLGKWVREKSTEHVAYMNILIFLTAITTQWSVFFYHPVCIYNLLWQILKRGMSQNSLLGHHNRQLVLRICIVSISALFCSSLGSAERDPGFTWSTESREPALSLPYVTQYWFHLLMSGQWF